MSKKLIRCAGSIVMLIMILAVSSNTFATNEIDRAKEEQEKMEAELKDTESALKSLEALKGDAEAYIKKMDGYVTNLTDNIYRLEQDSETKREAIAAKQAEISDIEADIASQYEAMKLRIQYMYENGEVSYLSMFFESEDMSDFLNRAEYLTEITEYDREMLVRLQDRRDALKLAKTTLDNELADLNSLLEEAEQERQAVEVLVAAKEKELSYTNSDIVSKEEAVKRLQEDIKAQEKIVQELEEIERRRQEEANNQLYDGGKMMWPLPGYSRLSSYFGNRSDPFTGLTSYHSGIDVPAPTGTKIYAIYDGTVAWSYKSDSAGNWVGIDHGNGITSIYMHMSKRLVSEGDVVKKGDVIGLVGSTGRSTGPHLHLSVRVNGAYADPLNYVSP